jgi:FtsZ-interacting cell division protein ZipA
MRGFKNWERGIRPFEYDDIFHYSLFQAPNSPFFFSMRNRVSPNTTINKGTNQSFLVIDKIIST